MRGTRPLTHTESSLNRGQTGIWCLVVQQWQTCHSLSISPSYSPLSIQSRKKPLLCSFLLPFAVWNFALSLNYLPFSPTSFFLSNNPSLQNFCHFPFTGPWCLLSVFVIHSSSVLPDLLCDILASRGFVPLSAATSCIALSQRGLESRKVCSRKTNRKWNCHCTH